MTACPKQQAYAAHRAAWRAEADQWLETRELPGWPLNDAHAVVLATLERREPSHG